MLWKIGDQSNGNKGSEQIVENDDYVSQLEEMLEQAGLYCEPADDEAKNQKDQIDNFIRENNRLGLWN